MSLLEQLKPEYRNAIVKTRTYVEPPANTPAHIKARMLVSMTAFCERRSVSPIEDSIYQNAATRFNVNRPVDTQAAIRKQIADWNKRNAKKKLAVADVRSIAAKYPEVSLEDIASRSRIYSGVLLEDVLLQLRAAAIGRQIRQGGGFEVGVQQPGAALDARPGAVGENCIGVKCSTREEHEEAAQQHSNIAHQAHSLKRAEAHYNAANVHRKAALESSLENSLKACATSRNAHTVKD